MFSTFIFIQTLAFAVAQYNDLKPDIGFGEHNDRFDISSLLRSQNKYYDKIERSKTRRDFGRMLDYSHPTASQRGLKLPEKFMREDNVLSRFFKAFGDDLRRDDVDQQTHLEPKTAESESDEDIVHIAVAKNKVAAELRRRNLQRYVEKLHEIHSQDYQARRRAMDPKEEILMHHAVPINFRVNGYLTAPNV